MATVWASIAVKGLKLSLAKISKYAAYVVACGTTHVIGLERSAVMFGLLPQYMSRAPYTVLSRPVFYDLECHSSC